MSIVSFVPMMDAGARSANLNVGTGKAYSQKFRIITDNQNDGQATIIAQLGYYYGQKYIVGYPGGGVDSDLFAYLTAIHLDSVGEDGIEWEATFEYSWYDATTVGGGKEQNPLDMPIEVNWGWRDYEMVIDVDVDGVPVLNTAFDPYDPPVLINDPRRTMTVVRNEATISMGLIDQYKNAINTDAWAGVNPFFAHCLGITPKNTFHQLVGWYYQVTYEFEFISPRQAANQSKGGELQGFRKLILNQGLRAISATTGKKYHVVYRNVPVSQPVLLDQSGEVIPDADISTKFVLNTVKAYQELPFTDAFNFDPLAIIGQRSGFGPQGGG